MKRKGFFGSALGLVTVFFFGGCDAIFGSSAQCTKHEDCVQFGASAVCTAQGICTRGGADASSSSDGAPSSTDDGSVVTAEAGPPGLSVAPATATLMTGAMQTFSANLYDGAGKAVPNPPPVTWATNGGGTISATGVFTATTAGGPFVVTATAGTYTATASVTVTKKPAVTVTMGETAQLAVPDSGNGDLLLAQEAVLAQAATLQSLTFLVSSAAGMLRLGVYDATGAGGDPGNLLAETAEFAPVVGWNTANVVTPVLLPAGTYWLAYAPSDDALGFPRAGDGTGQYHYFARPYGPMAAKFADAPQGGADHWSFYATLTAE